MQATIQNETRRKVIVGNEPQNKDTIGCISSVRNQTTQQS